MNNNRKDKFLEIFRLGMMASQEKQLKETLGDRSGYVGLSDLAKYHECPRAAIAAKLKNAPQDMRKLITFGRGHWFEQGVYESLNALELNQMRQVEVSCYYKNVPIVGHLDLVLVWEKPCPAVRILEIKSMENIPEAPYASHQWQVTAQTAMLKHCWTKPVFGIGTLKYLTFPELCREKLGLELPKAVEACSVEGWLLCLSMTNSTAFGPFNSDDDFLQELNIQALTMWRQLEAIRINKYVLDDVPYANGYYPLCASCDVNRNCPKFSVEAISQEFEPALTRLDQLKTSRNVLDNEIKEIESGLKLAHKNSGVENWISTGNHRFKVINAKGRKTLDRSLLEAELEDLFHALKFEGDTVEAFISRCEKEGSPSTRLSIQNLTQEV